MISSQISKGIDANREVEKASNTFDHFSGTVGTSTKMIAKLREMSADLGVSFKSMAGGGSSTDAEGFQQRRDSETHGPIGTGRWRRYREDESTGHRDGSGQDKGRFYAEEMQQLQEAGFSPVIELAQVLGVKIEDVRKEMEKGNVTWVELGKALDKATEAADATMVISRK